MSKSIQKTEFKNFVKDIKEKILSSQYEALKSVNKELIGLYWNIGKSIVLKQEEFAWGKSVVKNLSDELRKGFSVQNLWNMRGLKSLIAIELKIGKFKPEYTGKMNFYLSVLNDIVKLEDENPSIGIIICKEKKRTTVEYSLEDTTQPIEALQKIS